jgi:DNA-binding XRE family transcriptional regulator
MKSFKDHLNNELRDPRFKQVFDEEKHLLELGVKISETREKLGLSQKELAQKCHVTQQQLSKIENGVNCNLLTFVKISSSLGLNINLSA